MLFFFHLAFFHTQKVIKEQYKEDKHKKVKNNSADFEDPKKIENINRRRDLQNCDSEPFINYLTLYH